MNQFGTIVSSQRKYFEQGETLDISFRAQQLSTLRNAIDHYQSEISAALWTDLRKGPFEAHASEIGLVLGELNWYLRRLPALATPRRVSTPIHLFPSRSHILKEPHGVCLIISPWNYPLQLSIAPLCAALAAGNTAVLKLSERSPATSKVIADMVHSIFPESYVTTVIAGPKQSAPLLGMPFDMIFFTGSNSVGKIVCRAAADRMIPAVLELGGKNPCIVLADADIKTAARRIVWGKFFNGGQTCVAPDYAAVHQSIMQPLIAEMHTCIEAFYGPDPKSSPDYCRMIDATHTARLLHLLRERKLKIDSNIEERYIAPTLVEGVTWDDPLMADEIFGPILPIVPFDDVELLRARLKRLPTPLASYVFSKNVKSAAELFQKLSFGGGCVNDTLVHVSSPHLPFGGAGPSGMGRYHGEAGFEAFSRTKSMITTPNIPSINLRFPPYRSTALRILRKLQK